MVSKCPLHGNTWLKRRLPLGRDCLFPMYLYPVMESGSFTFNRRQTLKTQAYRMNAIDQEPVPQKSETSYRRISSQPASHKERPTSNQLRFTMPNNSPRWPYCMSRVFTDPAAVVCYNPSLHE